MCLVGSSVGVSDALVDAPLYVAQGLRYAAAAVLLLGVARLAGARVERPVGMEWLWLAGVAVTGLVLFNVAVVRGVEHAEPAVIAVAVAGAPVAIGLLGPVLEGRAPRSRVVTAAAVVTAGSALVEGTGATDAVGVAWAAVALACEAGFTLLALPVLTRHGAWGVSIHTTWIATVMLTLLSLMTEGHGALFRLERDDVLAVAYLAVAVTTAAFALWYSAVAGLGSGRAALLCGIAPAAAAVVGVATTGHSPGLLVWSGLIVIAGGLAVGLRSTDSRSDESDEPRGVPGTARANPVA
jgi:drug/metabolite transporter (DMT)-like permease